MDTATLHGFANGLKQAGWESMATGLGRAVVGGGMRAAKAVGAGQQATGLLRSGLRASPNLMRNVGIGTAAAGAGLGAVGAAHLARR